MYKFIFLFFSVAHGVEGCLHGFFTMELGLIPPTCSIPLSNAEEYTFKIKAAPYTQKLIIHTPCPVNFSLNGFEEYSLFDQNLSMSHSTSKISDLDNGRYSPFSDSTISQTLSDSPNATPNSNHKKHKAPISRFMTVFFETLEQNRKKTSPVKIIKKKISDFFKMNPIENTDHNLTIEIIIPKSVDVTFNPIYDGEGSITFGPIILKNHESV